MLEYFKEFDQDILTHPKVRFLGVGPSTEEKNQINQALARLEELAPSNATIQATFLKNLHWPEGTLTVRSFFCTFKTRAKGNDLSTIMRKLEQNMEKQLLDWKKKRSLHLQDSIKGMSVQGA